MSDPIDRQETISAMEGVDWYHIDKDGQLVHGANSKEDEPLYKASDVYAVLNKIPSAQPEKRTEERTETHACDLISRKAAIDAVNTALFPKINTAKDAEKALRALPSAQPEPLVNESPSLVKDLVNDTISRQAAIEWCLEGLNNMPFAQPIIRCKECKWFGDIGCAIRIDDDTDKPSKDDYCSFAERRTDEQTV